MDRDDQKSTELGTTADFVDVDHAIVLASAFVSQTAFVRRLVPASCFQRVPIGDVYVHALRKPTHRMSSALHHGLYAWMKSDLRQAVEGSREVAISLVVVLSSEDPAVQTVFEAFQVTLRLMDYKADVRNVDVKKCVRKMSRSLTLFVHTLHAQHPLPIGAHFLMDVTTDVPTLDQADVLFADDKGLNESISATERSERELVQSLGKLKRTVLGFASSRGLHVEFAHLMPHKLATHS